MRSYRRLAVVALAALVGASGCWNPSPEKYPSITFFGADYGTITVGTDLSGKAVQGAVLLTWQTRLADKVNLLATTVSTGKTTIVKTFKAGDTTSCTVDAQFPNSDCVKDGTYQVSPTEDTVYNIQATVGAGNCDRDKVLGNLLHPDQCNDLTADPNASLQVIPITVVAPSTISLTVNGSGTTTVAPGTDVVADYAVTGATAFDFGISGTDTNGNPSYTQCGPAGSATAPCDMPPADANGTPPTSGKITVPNVTANTVLTGESTNNADDTLGDVATNTTGATVNIIVPGTPSITTFTATPDHVNPSGGGTTVALAWKVASADTVAVTLGSSSTGAATGLSGCTGVDNTGAGTCNVSVTGTDGQKVVLDMVASNSVTGQTSGSQSVTVMIGNPPTVTFDASPSDLTNAGGNVVLTWTAAGAADVTITDGGGSTIVDTGAATPTNCDSGKPCDPTGDTITVAGVTASTTWTLTATNAFPGSTTRTATATLYGPPKINALQVRDSAPGATAKDVTTGGQVLVNTTNSATFAWNTTDVRPSSVSFSTAPVPAGGACAQVPTTGAGSWIADAGFSFTGASGTYALTTTGNLCYQFAYSGYAGQSGGTIVWEIQRKVTIDVVTLDGVAVTSDQVVTVAPKTAVTAAWSASNATGYLLDVVTGVPAGTNCSAVPLGSYGPTGGYVSPATTISLTSPATAPLHDCYHLTAQNYTVTPPNQLASFYFGIAAN